MLRWVVFASALVATGCGVSTYTVNLATTENVLVESETDGHVHARREGNRAIDLYCTD